MPISKFSFEDTLRGWKLNEVTFDDFNLLVGNSGVGKTRILRAIRKVVNAGTTGTDDLVGRQWMMEINDEDHHYRWSAETEDYLSYVGSIDHWIDNQRPELIRETIWLQDKIIVERAGASFNFEGKSLPRLKTTESAISLLRDEDSLSPLYRSLSRFIFSEAFAWSSAVESGLLPFRFERESVNRIREKYPTLRGLREAKGVHFLIKAYILQEDHPEEFGRVRETYTEIFPTVLDVKLAENEELLVTDDEDSVESREWLSLGIKEKGAKGWVLNDQISAGMLRSLVHLFEIALAAPGTVIIVDEFANSMGVNCLPQMTDHFLRHSDLQFILTSHHPYVINNIPWRYWKLVTREGAEVTVKDATSVPALSEASSLEKFTQLLNLEEYAEAIR